MWYRPIRSAWCRSMSSVLSTSPRQVGKVKENSWGFICRCINQCWIFCQKVWTSSQSQKRWIGLLFFVRRKYICLLKKYLDYFIKIIIRVAIFLWRSLNWKVWSLVSFVSRKARYMTYPNLWNFHNFCSRLSIYSGFYQVLKWYLWQLTYTPPCKSLRAIVTFDY